MKKLTVILSVSLIAILLQGCGSSLVENRIENAIENESGENADVNIGNDGVTTVTTADGSATFGGNELPENWPQDVTVYPGATISFAGGGTNDGNEGGMATFTTSDAATQVTAFYNDLFKNGGWTISGSANYGGTNMIVAEKGTETVSVSIAEANDLTTVTVGFGTK